HLGAYVEGGGRIHGQLAKAERARIWSTRRVRTLPGPSSSKAVQPIRNMHSTLSIQRTGLDIWRERLAWRSPEEYGSAAQLEITGIDGGRKVKDRRNSPNSGSMGRM